MYPVKLSDIENVAIRSRIAIERRIVRSLVNELISNGCSLRVDDGDEIHPITSTAKTALKQLMNTDQDRLYVYAPVDGNSRYIGEVFLVYGNDGWDVMSDWSLNLEKRAPNTFALAESEGRNHVY
jgi:hypothetical protein